MQTAHHLQPGITAQNIQPAHIPLHFHQPDSLSPNNTYQQFPRPRKYQTFKHPNSNNPNRITETDCLLQRNGYSIHLVNSLKQRIKASTLIKRMYASRGYQTENTSVFSTSSNQYTLEARRSRQLIGTLTLTIDSDDGLLADTLYKKELDQFRKQGRKLFEVSKLAFSPETSSKEIFACIFHTAHILGHYLHDASDAVVEINPRHAVFYKRMLGFKQIGELRTCPRVDAPAVLLQLNMEYMKEQIAALAERTEYKSRSIYPYFVSKNKEKEIIHIIQERQANPISSI